MIDIGFSKLMIIGVVALVVIGPEKLPRVARTAGTLLGRAQRYISDIKTEVSQQMNVEDLNEMKKTVEEAARHAQATLRDAESSVSKSLHDTNKEIEDVWNADAAKKPYTPAEPPVGKLENMTPKSADIQERLRALKSDEIKNVHVPYTSPVQAHMPGTKINSEKGTVHGQARWRAQRAATPIWYKRQTRSRVTLLSDAARNARKTP